MGYFDTDHLVGYEPTHGPSISFVDSVKQGWEQQFRVDSPYSLEAEVYNRWEPVLAEYRRKTGDSSSVAMDYTALNDYIRTVQGEDLATLHQAVGGSVTPETQQQLQAFKALNEKIKALNDPNLPSFENILADVVQMQQGVEQRTQEVGDRGSGIGQFIGAAAGSFSERDPLSLYTLGIGGFGRSILTRALTEGVVQAGLVGVSDVVAVNPNRELAGLPEHNPLYDMTAAAVGGAAIRGGLEGLGVVMARRAADAADNVVKDFSLDFNDSQLSQIVRDAPDAPAKLRAQAELLDMFKQLDEANPYGESAEAGRRFVTDLNSVAEVFGGQADTAVGRFLPELPFDFQARTADIALVQGEAPHLVEAMDLAEARLKALEAQSNALEQQIDNVSVADTLEKIDQPSAELVRSLESDLQKPGLTAEGRADIERKITQITESLGVDVPRAQEDLRIKPRKELQQSRKAQRAANAQYRKAAAQVQLEADRLKLRERALAGIEPPRQATIFDNPTGVLGPLMRRDAVAKTVETVDKTTAAIPDRAETLVRPVEVAEGEPPPVSDGLFDIGLDQPVDGSLKFLNEDGTEVTIADAMRELQDDLALEDAVKVCAI